MKRAYFLSYCSLLALAVALSPAEAAALQPLQQFYESARTHAFDAREQQARIEQRDWEVDAALGRLLPSFSARGVYQRNQYEAAVQLPGSSETLVITPHNQFDAVLQVDVPLLDLASYHRHAQAKHVARAAEVQSEVVAFEVQRNIARAYYSFIGASALAQAARSSLEMAEDNLRFVSIRHEAGAALQLDVERARANVERAKQDVADAALLRATAARSLETASGLTPLAVTEFPEDDLHSEGSLESWLARTDTPADRAQKHLDDAAASADRAATAALLPTLSVNAQERFTNATGFTGRSSAYTLQAVLSWRLDYATYATAKAQSKAAEAERIRGERAHRSVRDTIFDAHQRVEAGIAKCAAARAQADAAEKAAHLALERYRAGALTQLDVTQSQRDAFQAHVAQIQADADLSYARVVLRTTVGSPDAPSHASTRPLETPRSAEPPTRPGADSTSPTSAPSW